MNDFLNRMINKYYMSIEVMLIANILWHALGLLQRNRAPISTVPFNRDRKFIGRRDILRALESQLSRADSHNRVVLVGLGGVGYAFAYSVCF
jgi:hypothetical protein